MIFPRYHQLDCVKFVDALKNGTGNNYLIQHSGQWEKKISIEAIAHPLHPCIARQMKKVFETLLLL